MRSGVWCEEARRPPLGQNKLKKTIRGCPAELAASSLLIGKGQGDKLFWRICAQGRSARVWAETLGAVQHPASRVFCHGGYRLHAAKTDSSNPEGA
jgi:hypothetical protein